MSWFDDLEARAAQSLDNASNSAFSYFDSIASDPAVIIAAVAPAGNQSAAQIAAGQPGGAKGVAPAKASAASTMNAIGASMFSQKAMASYLPIIAIGAVAYFVFSRKG